MRSLGSVLHITPSRLIIVKLSRPKPIPPLNSEVLDAQGERIGTIVDIIGPVDSPYAVVKPIKPAVLSFVKPSMVLFYRPPRKERRKGGRKR